MSRTRLLLDGRRAAVLAFACCSTYIAASEAVRTSVVLDKTGDFLELVEPLEADLPGLGIEPDELIGYQDDYFRKPDGSGRFLYLTRLCLAPLRLDYSADHEWLLVVRVEGPVTDLDKSSFQKVREYFGMTLFRRSVGAQGARSSEEQEERED